MGSSPTKLCTISSLLPGFIITLFLLALSLFHERACIQPSLFNSSNLANNVLSQTSPSYPSFLVYPLIYTKFPELNLTNRLVFKLVIRVFVPLILSLSHHVLLPAYFVFYRYMYTYSRPHTSYSPNLTTSWISRTSSISDVINRCTYG